MSDKAINVLAVPGLTKSY